MEQIETQLKEIIDTEKKKIREQEKLIEKAKVALKDMNTRLREREKGMDIFLGIKKKETPKPQKESVNGQ